MNLFGKNLPAFAKTLPVSDLFSTKLLARWLPVMRQTPVHRMAMAAAGVAVTATAVAGPALAFDSQPHQASGTAQAAGARVALSGHRGGAAGAPAPAPGTASAQGNQAAEAHPAQAAPSHVDQPAQDAHPAQPTQDTQAAQAAQQAQQAQAAKQSLENSLPRDKEVSVDYQPQSTFFYCGPAATRIVASAQGHDVSQDDVAAQLGTTVNGTPSAVDTTRVLNGILGGDTYHTTSIPDQQPSQAQTDQVQVDMMRTLNGGRAVVANIAGATTDVTGATHDFAGGHYVAVVGYHDQGGTVEISDPADENGYTSYWISTSNLTQWMATHGYSSAS